MKPRYSPPRKKAAARGLKEDATDYIYGEPGKVTSKGQTTIPKRIREYLSLRPGDDVMYAIENGAVVLRARNKSVKHLKTILPRPNKAATLDEIGETIRKSWAGE